MSSLNSTTDIVHPEFFIIRGLSGVPDVNYYYFFLFFCYALTVMGNLFVMVIIFLFHRLHTPKYMAIFNLAVCDLGESTSLFPNVVEMFMFTVQKISYEACLANMFFVLLFFALQSHTLTVLAYDRFVAICFPLRYHSIVTNTSMAIIITGIWLFTLVITILMTLGMTTLSYCDSIVIESYFCNYGPFGSIACSDHSFTIILGFICGVLFYFLPVALIGLSYISILLSLFKIATWEERIKSLKTCSSHFIAVSVFYVPLIIIDMIYAAFNIEANARIFAMSLSITIPPVLNPIVYSLSTAEIRDFVRNLFQRNKHKNIVPAVSK